MSLVILTMAKLGGAHNCDPSTGKQRQEDSTFKA